MALEQTSEAARCANTERPLTRLPELTRKGAEVDSTHLPATATRPRPTWPDLVALEPRLAQLEAHVRRVAARYCADGHTDGNALWFGYGPGADYTGNGIKAAVSDLVGWNAGYEPTWKNPEEWERYRCERRENASNEIEGLSTWADLIAEADEPRREVPELLTTPEAYEVAYHYLHRLTYVIDGGRA